MMPEMDGYAFCQAIKTDPELDFIPVILLTAKASAESKIEGLEEGADDYLTKPFNIRELEARIHNLIASRQRLKSRFSQDAAPATSLLSSHTTSSADETFAARSARRSRRTLRKRP
ncbi:MAG TPA: response regulator [Rhodothermales bacterium]|nr:response regulator [Rhodothermales bacterium]